MFGLRKKINGWLDRRAKLRDIRDVAFEKELGKIQAQDAVKKESDAHIEGIVAARSQKGKWSRRVKAVSKALEGFAEGAGNAFEGMSMDSEGFELQGISVGHNPLGSIDDVFIQEEEEVNSW